MATIQCPTCGYEYEGDVCPVCGAKLGWKYRMRAKMRAGEERQAQAMPMPERMPETEEIPQPQLQPQIRPQPNSRAKAAKGVIAGSVVAIMIASAAVFGMIGSNISRRHESMPAPAEPIEWAEDYLDPNEEVFELEPQTVYEAEGVMVQITGYVRNDYSEILQVTMYNDSDHTVNISSEGMTINGVIMDEIIYGVVGPGETLTDELIFFESDLEDARLESIDEIGFQIQAMNAETYELLPEGERVTFQSPAGSSTWTRPTPEGKEVYNANGLRVLEIGLREDPYRESLTYYFENNSDRTFYASTEDGTINGKEPSDFFYGYLPELPPGSAGYMDISLYDFLDEGHTLDDVKDVTMPVTLYGADWDMIDQFVLHYQK